MSATLAVRPASSVITLPHAAEHHVVGVLPDDPVLSVISPFGAGADAAHVLVVTTPARDFGLLVDAVTEIVAVAEDRIRPAPAGGLVVAVAERPDGVILIADPEMIGGWR